MACTAYSSYADMWLDFAVMDAILCPFTDQLGMAVFALFTVGGLGLVMYAYTDSLALPAVLAVILGSVAIVELPAEAINIGTLALIGLILTAVYLLYQRANRTV